jgi:hypothetical protein
LEPEERRKKQKIETLAQRRKIQNAGVNFLDIEAEVDGDDISEDEDDDDDDHVLTHDSFINDSSQLGYTQDELDKIDNEIDGSLQDLRDGTNVTLHRQVDMMKEQEDVFATPILRRKKRSMTQLSLPSSEKHLGQMHVIRSVIEHHRQGGDADELEREYHEILKSSGLHDTPDSQKSVDPSSNETTPNHPTCKPLIDKTSKMTTRSALTAEQLERIQQNRQKALMIRQQKMNQM